MGKPVKGNIPRVDQSPLNISVNKKSLDAFKDYCGEYGYSMNNVLEPFMRQYANNRFHINADDILKWKNNDSEKSTLSTSLSKEIYDKFKTACTNNGYKYIHVITAFLEIVSTRSIVLEYVDINEVTNPQPQNNFSPQHEQLMVCPRCRHRYEAVASNWCLRKFEGENDYRIVCKENCSR